MPIEHKNIPDAQLHETKGAASATLGQILTANGDGTATFQTAPYSLVEMGWYDYNDTLTASTPIALTLANTYYDLTNNGLGVNTNIAYGLAGVANLWIASTVNRFNFTGLDIGDTVDLRIDISVTTTTANTQIKLDLELASGTGSAFYLPAVVPINFKTAGTYRIVQPISFYIGSAAVRDNVARLRAQADTTGTTVVVNGWFIRAIKHG